MADTTPLTDEERAELEQLRAEKVARAQREQAARDRRELEQLKAEKARAASEAEADARAREIRDRNHKLMVPDDEDLKMPLAQKIVLAVLALVVIVVVASFFIKG